MFSGLLSSVLCLFLGFLPPSLLFRALCVALIMRGGCKGFAAIKSKSFDLAVVGIKAFPENF